METKTIRLHLGTKRGKKTLARLLAEGWVIQVQQKRSMIQTSPGQTDLILTRG